MNKCILLGRITKDLELKYSQGATPIAILKFSIAVAKKFKKDGEADADFLNCTAFGKTAETIDKFFSKGNRILIESRVQTGSYEKDGVRFYTTDFLVESFNFIESNSENTQKKTSHTTEYKALGTAEDVNDEDSLPF